MEKFAEVDADIGDEEVEKSTGRDDYNQNIFLLYRFHAVSRLIFCDQLWTD